MPRVPDASMATRVIKAAATVTSDPAVKSRTFVAPLKGGYQSAQLRASDVQRYRLGTVLSAVAWKGRQRQGTRFLTSPPPPLSAVYTYNSELAPNALPSSGEVGVALTNPSSTLYLSMTDQNGAIAIDFLYALLSASTITFTSGSNVLTMPRRRDSSDRVVSTYAALIVVASQGDLTPFETGDVITITYA